MSPNEPFAVNGTIINPVHTPSIEQCKEVIETKNTIVSQSGDKDQEMPEQHGYNYKPSFADQRDKKWNSGAATQHILVLALVNGHPAVAKGLLAAGANVNARGEEGKEFRVRYQNRPRQKSKKRALEEEQIRESSMGSFMAS
ncbi:hypothetical protein PG985_011174 [Apiospora marii]